MFVQILILLAGLTIILLGANYLVDGSSAIARKTGISEFVIGLTIVGIGTSAPEMVVSFISAAQGNADMAVGNIIGSNIFNTLLILGTTAIISPLVITKRNLKLFIPMNIIAAVLLIVLGMSGTLFGFGKDVLGRIDGLILLSLFAYYMYVSFKGDSQEEGEGEDEEQKNYSNLVSILMIVGGLAGLIIGGKLFVNSGSAIAKMAGVSDAFIAITVLAGGTSMPELATCVVAAFKGKGQLALGNILGSNISNILLILGGSALIAPLAVQGITTVDLGVLLLCSLVLLISAYILGKYKISRTEGIIMLLIEAGYMTLLISSL